MLDRDVEELDCLIAGDCLFKGPDGTTVDKAADLETHRSGRLLVQKLEPLDTTVDVVDENTAELILLARMRVTFDGEAHEGAYRYTRRYERRDGRWQVTFAQAVPARVE